MNKNKVLTRVWSVLLAILLVVMAVPVAELKAAASDEGTSGTPQVEHQTTVPEGYVGIYTKADLDNVRKDLTGNYILMNDIVFSEADFEEGGTYYNDRQGWLPIGNGSLIAYRFSGILDGNGYAVRGLQMHLIKPVTDDYNVRTPIGLIGYLDVNGMVKNLTLTGGSIDMRAYFTRGLDVGGVVGTSCGQVINCRNENPIEILQDSYMTLYIGGVVGASYRLIRGCLNTGTIHLKNNGSYTYVGGVCGKQGAVSDYYAVIENSANYGDISVELGSNATGDCLVGGLAATGGMGASNSYNAGDITVVGSVGGTFTGEVSGIASDYWNNATINSCCNLGDIRVDVTSLNYNILEVSGICARTGLSNGKNLTISNCFNAGNLEARATCPRVYDCRAYASGIGSHETCKNSYNIGEITANADCIEPTKALAAAAAINAYYSTLSSLSGVTNFFYLDNVTDSVRGISQDTDQVKRLTMEQMKQQATFAGFDFETVWQMDSGSYQLPTLRGLPDFSQIGLQIGGAPEISGTVAVGQTLTASSKLVTPGCAKVRYQWNRNGNAINGATQSSYTLTEDDFDSLITVTAMGDKMYLGSVTSDQTQKVGAGTQTAPPAPQIASVTDATATLAAVEGYEYSKDGTTWQKEPLFTGLNRNTSYTFYQRKAPTTCLYASPKSEGTSAKTSVTIISGTISITGIAASGNLLTVDKSGLIPSDATMSYIWTRNGQVIEDQHWDVYRLTAADSGTEIAVKVKGNWNFDGWLTAAPVKIKERELSSIIIDAYPHRLTYKAGERLDTDGLVVRARYDDGTSEDVTNYQVTGYDPDEIGNQSITVTYQGKNVMFEVTVNPAIPSAITGTKHKVTNDTLSRIGAGTTVAALLGSIPEKAFLKVYRGSTLLGNDAIIGTGLTVKIMDGNTQKRSYQTIVTGDINGDGAITITDMIAVKSALLGKQKLSGVYQTAADTNGDEKVTITDFIQFKSHLLGKSKISAR